MSEEKVPFVVVLMSANQDTVHKSTGKTRVVKSKKVKNNGKS